MEQRNLILAIVISVAILFGFQFLFPAPKPPAPAPATSAAGSVTPAAPGAMPAALTTKTRSELIAETPRVRIDSPRLSGSINLLGGRLDDVILKTYKETVEPGSPSVSLLHPVGRPDAYFAETGWSGEGIPADQLPGNQTLWTADRDTLTPEQPLTLSWTSPAGLKFIRQYSIDRDFMVTITQRVENTGSTAVTLYPYGLVSRTGTPHTQGFFILHEGMVGVLNGKLEEHKYDSMKEEGSKSGTTKGGWLGFTDKYWLVALAPSADEEVKTTFRHVLATGDKWQADYLGTPRQIAPGAAAESAHRLFVGAKEVKLLQRYSNDLKIEDFDKAVDWGWFFFLTKPIFELMNFIHGLVGNFGIVILLLTVIIKAIFFPLANRSYVMMSKMRKLTPKMMELREKYADDREKMNQELMGLYRKEKVNPLSGCLPIVLQIPVFFSLYKVLFVTIEMRHQPFFGWIHDLTSPDPTTIFNLFGLIPWAPPAFLMIGAWPLIMGVTMYLQMKLNPQPTDPIQAKMFAVMPVIFTFMLASFPAGLVIYWAWNNLLSIAQQWAIMKRQGAV
jgi:YidC/Oxa1 family membrane protein insertase